MIVLCALTPHLARAGGLFTPSAENMTLTEYDDVTPIVEVHAARVFIDHEKYGFFRLGLAPLAVIQGVRVQVASASRLTNALANLSSWGPAEGNLRHLEVRDLEISLFGEKEPRLRAGTARPNPSGALELSHVSFAGGPPAAISKASLQMTGPAAGTLRWRDGQVENELLILKPPEPKKP
jgi:hypothetical protein